MTKGFCPEVGKITPYVPLDSNPNLPLREPVLFAESFDALPPRKGTTEPGCVLRRKVKGKALAACEGCEHYLATLE